MVKTSGGVGSLLDWGAKTPRALQPNHQNIKQKQYCKNSIKALKICLLLFELELVGMP